MENKAVGILWAFIAAVFYALNSPFSKYFLEYIGPTFMASLLYLGTGIGMAAIFLGKKQYKAENLLAKKDLPYVIGMVALDVAAPVFMMWGLKTATASSAALLNNFEIVATTLIALIIFKEKVSFRLWIGIILVTASAIILSFEGGESLSFSKGSVLILCATLCWGIENNCTRQISSKNTYEIVMIKGLGSGIGALILALCIREELPVNFKAVGGALLLGFVAYGLSVFFYVKGQKVLGAAKTSAYYAAAPFIGAFLSFVLLKEQFSAHYFTALLVMILGTVFVVKDTIS